MTLEDFSKKINKSVATLSKYENGSISIDIETLFEIADVLDCDVSQLIDYTSPKKRSRRVLPQKSIFGSNDMLYMYFFDGRINKVKSSLIHLQHNPVKECFEATMYMDIQTIGEFQNCEHLYFGEFKPFDTISNFHFENQVNNIEQLTINVINPLNNSNIMVGLLTGITGYPLFPSATKVILSRTVLTVSEELAEMLHFSKEEQRILKKLNMVSVAWKNYIY